MPELEPQPEAESFKSGQPSSAELWAESMDVDQVANEKLDQWASELPEVQQKLDALKQASRELIEAYNIQPDFFADDARSLVFAAIADIKSRDPDGQFAHDALVGAAHDYSDVLGQEYNLEQSPDEIDGKAHLQILNSYTDQRLSARMKQAIQNGLLSEVQSRLGVTPENEDPYILHVLDIGDNTQLNGLEAAPFPAELPDDEAQSKAIANQVTQERRDVQAWRDRLIERGQDMAHEMGQEALVAPIFVSTIEGEKHLCISAPLAEKLLDPDILEGKGYSPVEAAHDQGAIEHEYAHTQGGLSLNGEHEYGSTVEELRAEHYSGNKNGYMEIKHFSRDYYVATGDSVESLFEGMTKGGSQAEIYQKIAGKAGLEGMLKVLSVLPPDYVGQQTNPRSARMQAAVGGFDGVTTQIMNHHGDDAGVAVRVDERARLFIEITNGDYENILAARRQAGLQVVTDMIEARAGELSLAA